MPLILALPGTAFAQTSASATEPAAAPANADPTIDFSADRVEYQSDADIVTASGRVRMSREGNYLAADRVVWLRKTGEVTAEGNVVVVNPQGDKLVSEKVVLTDELRDGTIDNLLVVLESGGRIAARRATRTGDRTVLDNAVYSPCPVTTPAGCPRNPSWRIIAARVIQDSKRNRIRFESGRLELFGVSLPLLPMFSVGTGGGKGGVSGLLIPNFSINSNNGFEIALPYHWQIGSNRDFTLTPHAYSGAWPAIEGRYRELNSLGAFQVGGFATYGKRVDSDLTDNDFAAGREFRGYFEGNGKAQFDPLWSLTGAFRVATDKTVTRQYDITRDDKLRSFANLERISPDAYFSLAGWAFQGLRVDDVQKRIPFAFPALDARIRLDAPIVGGKVELQANSLSIIRAEGQDTQRAFASARWDLRRVTPWGQEMTLTALGRADAYHTDDSASTSVAIYRGTDGWHFRGIGALAGDLKWPLVGELFGGVQRLVPRVQMVVTPPTPNLAIPNEDARAVDLEDSNLFALSRFPGYDRWEDGSRITYGVEWSFERPNLSITNLIGQSYRLTRDPGLFPDGTGLTDRLSDVVGRTRVRYGRWIDFTQRFRLDKDNFAFRRNEVDLTFGSEQTYAQIGYLRLNRDISSAIEDLRDKEELRLAGRVKFARYWSLFGATVLDLTGQQEDPLSQADGFEPVRHRVALAYEDECLELGVSWRRDYERLGNFRKGSTFSFSFALKGLGR